MFAFFTDPEKMVRWKGKTVQLDARVGGAYHIDFNGRDIAVGEYTAIEPPNRLVFTWGWEGSDGTPPWSSTVEVTLTADGDETIVRLVHSDLPEGAGAAHAEGWNLYLPRLAIVAVGGDPGPDPNQQEGDM